MLGLFFFSFIVGSWAALHLPVMPSISLLQACLFYIGQSSVYIYCYPSIQRSIWVMCFFGFGFLLSADAVLHWHMRKRVLLPNDRVVLRCGQLIQPLHMALPSERWLFRLSTYSRFSSIHRYDQFILHAYQNDEFHESEYLCVRLKGTRSRGYRPWSSLKLITQGVVGHAQLKKVIFQHALNQSIGQKVRHSIRQWVWHFPSEQVQHFLLALTIGDRSSMTRDDWRLFSKTGTSHLVAISGLHVMWVVLGLGSLLISGMGFVSAIYELIPRGILHATIMLVLSVIYGVIIYPSPPSERALLLLMISALGQLCGVRYTSSNMLWVVLLLSCFVHPFFIFQASACLSYWAAYCLWQSSWLRRDASCRSWVLLQAWMLAGLMPLSLYYFGQWYGVSLIANLLVVPWVGLIIFPVLLMSLLLFEVIPSCSHGLFAIAQSLIEGMFHCLSILSRFSFLSFEALGFGFFQVVLCFLILFSVRLVVFARYFIGFSFPVVLFVCLGSGLPKKVVTQHQYGVGCKEVRTIRSKDLSVLQVQNQSRSFYRYVLPQYRSQYHWKRFRSCVSSDRYAAFPTGLCASTHIVRYRHHKADACIKPARWVSVPGVGSGNSLIYLSQGQVEALL